LICLHFDRPPLAALDNCGGLTGGDWLCGVVRGQALAISHDEQRQREEDERRQEHNTHEWAGKQGRQSLHQGSVSRSLGCHLAKTKGNKRFATEIGPTVLAPVRPSTPVSGMFLSRVVFRCRSRRLR